MADTSLMEQDPAVRKPKKRRAGGGSAGSDGAAASTAAAAAAAESDSWDGAGSGPEGERRIQRVKALAEIYGCKLFASKV